VLGFLIAQEEIERLERALDDLPDHWRVIVLGRLQGRQGPANARALGLTPKAEAGQYERAVQRLREWLSVQYRR